jgi:hypothetical protein
MLWIVLMPPKIKITLTKLCPKRYRINKRGLCILSRSNIKDKRLKKLPGEEGKHLYFFNGSDVWVSFSKGWNCYIVFSKYSIHYSARLFDRYVCRHIGYNEYECGIGI